MTNPFEVPDADYPALRNSHNWHALWPAAINESGRWTVLHGQGRRQDRLADVRENCVDLRPADIASFLESVAQ